MLARMRRNSRRFALFAPALVLAAALAMHVARAQQPPATDGGAAAPSDGGGPPPPPETGGGEEHEASDGPERVTVGLFLDHVPVIDVHSNTYLADFYLWFRWKGDIDPTESYELTNAVQAWDILKVPVYTDDDGKPQADTLDDGTKYQCIHIQGTFWHAFPLHDYPFDEQDVVIELEDADHLADELVYVAETSQSGHEPGLEIPGWTIEDSHAAVTIAHYPTNFGDPRVRAGGDDYEHFEFRLHVKRPVVAYLVKTILPIAIVILITFIVFLIDSKYFEGRLGLAITSLISAVALQLTAASDLPSVGYSVLLDRVYDLAYLVIFLSLVESVIAVRLADGGKEDRARAVDKMTLIVLLLVFFGGVAGIVFVR